MEARVASEWARAAERVAAGEKICHLCYDAIGAKLFHEESNCKCKPIYYDEDGEAWPIRVTRDHFAELCDYSAYEYLDAEADAHEYYAKKAITAVFGTVGKELDYEYKYRISLKNEEWAKEEEERAKKEEDKRAKEEEARKAAEAAKVAATKAAYAKLKTWTSVSCSAPKNKKDSRAKVSLDELY